jgi:ABC-type phosphate transport system substrate-binding protein
MNRYVMMLFAGALLFGAGSAAAQDFVLVVNAANPVSELSKSEVSNIFFKKQGRWPGGNAVVAVDLDKGSPVRDAFSRTVHGRPASAVLSYWQQQIFSGKDVPPAERGSDADVLAFVRGNPNAVGYVSAGAALGSGVKGVQIK